MINYVILAGSLVSFFSLVQLIQQIYILKQADKSDLDSIKRTAFWGTLISSTIIAIGLITIGISIFTRTNIRKILTVQPSQQVKHSLPFNPYQQIHKGSL